MNEIMGTTLVVCFVGMLFVSASPVKAREATLKIGGGVLFKETQIGGNFQVDIPVAKEGKIVIAPFVDAYVSKSWIKVAGGGLNLLFKAQAGEGGKIYFGAGGGYGQARKRGEEATGALLNGVLGGEFSASEKISIFIQARGLALLGGEKRDLGIRQNLDISSVAIEAGFAFNVGN